MKKIIFGIFKIILLLVQIPLWFVNLFYGVGYMPNIDTGKIEEVFFYHTMYENISDLGYSFLFYISIVLVTLSFTLTIINLIKDNKIINQVSNVISIVSITLFIILLVIASTVSRGY